MSVIEYLVWISSVLKSPLFVTLYAFLFHTVQPWVFCQPHNLPPSQTRVLFTAVLTAAVVAFGRLLEALVEALVMSCVLWRGQSVGWARGGEGGRDRPGELDSPPARQLTFTHRIPPQRAEATCRVINGVKPRRQVFSSALLSLCHSAVTGHQQDGGWRDGGRESDLSICDRPRWEFDTGKVQFQCFDGDEVEGICVSLEWFFIFYTPSPSKIQMMTNKQTQNRNAVFAAFADFSFSPSSSSE